MALVIVACIILTALIYRAMRPGLRALGVI